MNKTIIASLLTCSLLVWGCSDNTTDPEEETIYDYSYRVDVPEGFQAEILFSFHEEPTETEQFVEWFQIIEQDWKSDTFTVSLLSQTPNIELRIRDHSKIDVLDDVTGVLTAQIIVEGTVVREEIRELPQSGSIGLGFDFLNDEVPN